MQVLRRLLCSALVLAGATALLPAAAAAAPAAPKEGVQYQVLPQQQETQAGKAVEVTEFFAYYCPHCNAFEPLLSEWVKKQGNNIVFKRVHVSAGPRVVPQQRLFYTLDAMGLLGQYHEKAFAAIHEGRLRFADDEEVFDWAAKAGIDRARFTDTYRSMGVSGKLRHAASMMDAYKVDHWPFVAIDGRFVTSPSMANKGDTGARTETEQQQVALGVMDALVAKARADKK
ncbi:MAG: thiol:disulfide interchange protein DsbA/DsbL [Pseudomonadota bacterium]